MDLKVVDEPEHDRFAIYADGAEAGFVRYRTRPGLIALTHTETDEALEGHGIATTLITEVLDEARRRGLYVLPNCPFVKSYLRRHPEYLALIPESRRAELTG